jgi:hypothetical protein
MQNRTPIRFLKGSLVSCYSFMQNNGYGYGDGYGFGFGFGYGYGYGNRDGCGLGYGLASGDGYGIVTSVFETAGSGFSKIEKLP